jgi:hypothetical protein
MNLNIEARVPKLETLTFDCLKELKTISKTLIEIEKLKRLKLKPKQHVFPLSLQGANREATNMYDQIQELKRRQEEQKEKCSCTEPHTPGEFPACLVPSYKYENEFPSVLTPRMVEDPEFAMKIRVGEPHPYVKPKLVVMTDAEEQTDTIQSCIDACTPGIGPDESTSDK